MMPTLAQGAAISLEDGFALARNLARHRDDPLRGLAAYEAERRPRASRVVLQAREQFQNNRKNPGAAAAVARLDFRPRRHGRSRVSELNRGVQILRLS